MRLKILIAPDSFKNSLPSVEACEAIAEGVLQVFPHAEIIKIPMADGGEGTVDAILPAMNGKKIPVMVHDPLMRPVESFLGISGDGETAIIEMAAASGIERLSPAEQDPWITTTYGTGELIKKALDLGCRKIIIGIGGSATVDGGCGMAQALGIRFLDKQGNSVPKGGQGLKKIARIDMDNLDKRVLEAEILIASDVENVLLGPSGAAYVYGPQKGADGAMVKKLDEGLKKLADQIKQTIKTDISAIPGSGAAGGLGAGFMAFLQAKVRKGFEVVSEITRLEKWVENADMIITGEGKIDFQTTFGKTPAGVATLARKYQKPLIAFAGTLGQNWQELLQEGFYAIIPIADNPMNMETSLQNAKQLLRDASARTFRLIKLGKNI